MSHNNQQILEFNLNGRSVADMVLQRRADSAYMCPDCNGTVTVDKRWFQCNTTSCGFSGNPATMLVVGLKTQPKRLAAIRALIGDKHGNIPEYDLVAFLDSVERHYHFRNTVIAMMADAITGQGITPAVATGFAFLRLSGIDATLQPNSISVISAQRMTDLVEAGRAILPDEDWPKQITTNFAVIPYWSSPGVLHSLMFFIPRKNPKPYYIEFSQLYRYGFTGLMDADVTRDGISIADNAYDALASNTNFELNQRSRFVIAARTNPLARIDGFGWLPQTLRVTAKSLGSNHAALLARAHEVGCTLSFDATLTHAATWLDFAEQEVIKALSKGQDYARLDPDEDALLAACNLPPTVKQRVIRELIKRGKIRKAEAVIRAGHDQILFIHGNTTYHQVAGTYVVDKAGVKAPITNFTLELDQVVVFADTAKIAFAGQIQCEGKTVPVTLTTSCLHNAADLDQAIQQAGLRASTPLHRIVPLVCDRQKMKPVMAHWLYQSAVLPRVAGIPRIGWGADYMSYYTFDGQFTAGRFDPTVTQLNPEFNWTNFHSELAVQPAFCGDTLQALPKSWQEVIAVFASVIFRSAMRYPQKALVVAHTPEALRALNLFYTLLGQKSPIVVNTRDTGLRLDHDLMRAFNGFPVLIISHDQTPAKVAPGHIVLGHTGHALDLDESKIEAAVLCVVSVIQEIVTLITVGNITKLRAVSGVDAFRAAVSEGAAVIEAATGFKLTVSHAPGNAVDLWLSKLPVGDLHLHCLQELTTQRVHISNACIPAELIADVHALLSATPDLRFSRISDSVFTLDTVNAANMMTTFYQEPVKFGSLASSIASAIEALPVGLQTTLAVDGSS